MSQGSVQLLGLMLNTEKHKKGPSPAASNKNDLSLCNKHRHYVEPQE